ncbi:MAG: hypothetical protein KDF54_14540, partial [Hydrogenophaga sp.]|nr:hypothetical protein [Hydrogenophaga sp.]
QPDKQPDKKSCPSGQTWDAGRGACVEKVKVPDPDEDPDVPTLKDPFGRPVGGAQPATSP